MMPKTVITAEGQQTCKVCKCEDKFDFKVPDDIWQKVVPGEYREKVVCLKCFDQFAFERGVKYSGSLLTLYFAGDQAALKFELVAAHES